MDVKDYIISESDKLFCRHGFKSVTMDDIAKHLGMSKKTIYTHFSDKNEIVNIVIRDRLEMQTCMTRDMTKEAENAVHEVIMHVTNMSELLSNMNPTLFYDLQKYHPQAWIYFRDFRNKSIYETIYNNILRGIDEGLYRNDIKPDIITHMRLQQVDIVFSQGHDFALGKYTMAQIMAEITEHFLYGLCNEEGVKLIGKYKSNTEEQPT